MTKLTIRAIKPEGDVTGIKAEIKSLKLWITWYCILSPFGTAALMLFLWWLFPP